MNPLSSLPRSPAEEYCALFRSAPTRRAPPRGSRFSDGNHVPSRTNVTSGHRPGRRGSRPVPSILVLRGRHGGCLPRRRGTDRVRVAVGMALRAPSRANRGTAYEHASSRDKGLRARSASRKTPTSGVVAMHGRAPASYPRWGSNPHCGDFKSPASASWATGACTSSYRGLERRKAHAPADRMTCASRRMERSAPKRATCSR